MGNTARKLNNEDYDFEIINSITWMFARPNLTHENIVGNLYVILKMFLKGKKCKALYEPEVKLQANMNVFIPDVAIVCDPEKIANGQRIEGAPDLVVEILSPSTALRDMTIKKEVYEKYGVKEYWIVSPDEKAVQIFILKDGQFGKSTVYMIEDGKDSPIITTSLYGDDLKISLEEIFAQ
jgi:Uma2 family endonuclease